MRVFLKIQMKRIIKISKFLLIKSINNISEKIILGANVNDLTPNYYKHKKISKEKMTISDKVWNDIKYDYSINYNNKMPYHLDKNFGDKYTKYNDKESLSNTPYYEPNENDEYYKKSRFERIKLKFNDLIKKIVRFIKDFSFFISIIIIYNIFSGFKESKSYL